MVATDRWNNSTFRDLMFSDRWEAITPGAGDLNLLYKAVYCIATGNATFVDRANNTLTLTAFPAFQMPPVRPSKITASTATWIGLF